MEIKQGLDQRYSITVPIELYSIRSGFKISSCRRARILRGGFHLNNTNTESISTVLVKGKQVTELFSPLVILNEGVLGETSSKPIMSSPIYLKQPSARAQGTHI